MSLLVRALRPLVPLGLMERALRPLMSLGPIAAGLDGEGLAPVGGAAVVVGADCRRWANRRWARTGRSRWGQLDSARAGFLHRYVPLHHGGGVDDAVVVGDGLRVAD